MKRTWALALSLLFTLAVFAGEAPDYLLLVVETPPSDGIIARDLELGQFIEDLSSPAAPKAFLEQGDQLAPLLVQFNTRKEEPDRLLIRVPENIASGARIRLYPSNGPEGTPPLPKVTLAAESTNGVITVNNGIVTAVHDPTTNGGLPSKITFLDTGKVFEGYFFNDRIYNKETGAFSIRHDTQPETRLVSSGPIEAVVEVRARYMQGDTPAPTGARAVYQFRYRAGSPAIEIVAACRQDISREWRELHLTEWHFPSRPLKQWATGASLERGEFTEDSQSLQGSAWACLSDGTHVFGLFGGSIKLYSGTPTYGSYVHGPWVPWSGLETTLRTTAWLDAGENAVDGLAEAATAPPAEGRARLSTPQLEDLRQKIAERLAATDPANQRAQHAAWRFSRYTRPDFWEASLEDTRELLQVLSVAIDRPVTTSLSKALEHQAQLVHLFDDTLGVTAFDPANQRTLLSLFSFPGRREFLSGVESPLWTMTVEDAEGRESVWSSLDAFFTCEATQPSRPEDEHKKASLVWTGTDAAEEFTVTVDMVLETPGLAMTLKIANESKHIAVNRIEFPVLSLRPIGDAPEDDQFLVPTVSGAVWPAPLVNGISVNARYPSGWGSMQFGAHYDSDAGLYMAVHDPVAATKHYRVVRDDSEGALDVRIEWPAPDASVPGNDFETPGPAVLAVFEGDWFDAAQIYRTWVEREARWWPHRRQWGRPDIPPWLMDVCVWGRPGGSADSAVPQTLAFAEYMGVPTAVHWYSWHEIPFDNNYPHYFPAKEGFAEGVAELQKAGVRVMPYINGRLWDSDTEDFQSVALPAATKKRDGSHYIEHYGSDPEDLVPMCPTQEVWQNKVQEVVLRLIGSEFNVDGVYIDQVAAAAPVECYDRSHGHPLGGGHWWTTQGYWPMLEELNGVINERFPDKMLTTECNAEPYTHLFDGYLTWHFQYDHAVPAFAAVYGGKVVMFGRADRGNDLQAHLARTGQALVWGEQLGWYGTDYMDRMPRAAEYLRRCVRVRNHLLTQLAHGRMLRPPDVEGEIPEITANWAWGNGDWPVTTRALQTGAWTAEDGSVAIIFANTVEQPLTFSWVLNGNDYPLKGETIPCKRVTEEGSAADDPMAAGSKQTVTLEPLDVTAYLLTPSA
ncbi:MAG: DUF6259 domain-containing protein [Candidatus Hydrogenedentota bacterium]